MNFYNIILKFLIISFIIGNYELPYRFNDTQIINHRYYTLSYNEKHEQANWVAYILKPENFSNNISRTNHFKKDLKINTGSANTNDYTFSGYDRGHLVPAGDMKINKFSMNESFLMSNISPQLPAFNQIIWKKLEELIRAWAEEIGLLYIATGPILNDELNCIGKNHVSVPNYFYKVILDYTEPEIKAIGFIMPNKKTNKKIKQFAVSIDKVEEWTGIDFFYSLPDSIENKIESDIQLNQWNFNAKISKKYRQETSYGRCTGITKKGTQCKRNANDEKGKCFQH